MASTACSVGSNVAETMAKKTPDDTKAWQADHPVGESRDK